MKAFPTVTGSTGMELRDYFAAKAMQELVKVWVETDIVNLEMITKDAYKIADAMVEARDK
jgi:pyruvate dehydrogenase complex dehydrogenase (E1) component